MSNAREIKAVLFDLDGTLIFHDQSLFLSEYFKSISAFVKTRGLDSERFINSTTAATMLVLNNDGSSLHKDLFWREFFKAYGKSELTADEIISVSDEYYLTEFKALRQIATANPNAKRAVDLAHKNGRKVVLATNPVFPMTAQLERLSWSGLCESDFDLITSYENSSFCKPNPEYYFEICRKIGVAPENAFMIGNDEREDMKGSSEAGLMGYLATDCRIIANDFYWTGQRGTFEQSLRILDII